MAGPKGKTTRSKKGMRRSHHTVTTLTAVKCDNCGELKMSHSACPSCGHYKKQQVLNRDEL